MKKEQGRGRAPKKKRQKKGPGAFLAAVALANLGFAAARYARERREILRAVSDDEGVRVILTKKVERKSDRS